MPEMMLNHRPEKWGLISIYTGDGKGKTTAALGTALRAAAQAKRVCWIAFDKGGEKHYSERAIIRSRLPEIEFYASGLNRIHPVTQRFRFGVTDEDRAEGARGLLIVERIFQEARHELVVLDEINSSAALGIVEPARVIEIINAKPAALELILTGRRAPGAFLSRADLVTEMRLEKHYFYQGIAARAGIDY